ncbi:MAG: elongation factor Ts [Deltaproteobacteria bacterium CG11_big_fil_rev_8_21_14_0_20_45_16]|nr:MAG: elongation factor Ts [Deltaproteobacteria bacterium CG11_big_fil_rev_8_21_14_0_20_45_16]
MAADISAAVVQDLRQRTGAGMMDCKKALVETGGDLDKAVDFLRKKGIASAEKKAGREAKQGAVTSYIHGGGRIGVMLEVNCETDFVARNESFQEFSRDVAMHVAATNPQFLKKEDVPVAVLEKEKEILLEQMKSQGKPEAVMNKIIEGKLAKYYEENCLMHQSFVKDPEKTIEDYLKETIAKIGENIVIRRFVRFELGQSES